MTSSKLEKTQERSKVNTFLEQITPLDYYPFITIPVTISNFKFSLIFSPNDSGHPDKQKMCISPAGTPDSYNALHGF